MSQQRRQLMFTATALAALVCTGAYAQGRSGKVTRILVGFPAGQATDQVARLIADRLQRALDQTFIVENKPGQGGSIALGQLAKSPADGTVLSLSALASYVVNPTLYANVTYDVARDFDSIALVADLPLVLTVHPSLPVKTLQELINYAKANPANLSHSSSGNGTLSHLLMEDLKRRSGMNILHVPYQGSARGLVDLIAGTVQVGLDTATVMLPQVKAGKLRLIAVGSSKRLPDVPDVPTISELGFPGFEAVAWIGLTSPAGMPRSERERIQSVVTQALNFPEFAEKLRSIGAIPRPMPIDEFAAFMRSEQVRWKALVEQSGVKL